MGRKASYKRILIIGILIVPINIISFLVQLLAWVSVLGLILSAPFFVASLLLPRTIYVHPITTATIGGIALIFIVFCIEPGLTEIIAKTGTKIRKSAWGRWMDNGGRGN